MTDLRIISVSCVDEVNGEYGILITSSLTTIEPCIKLDDNFTLWLTVKELEEFIHQANKVLLSIKNGILIANSLKTKEK